MGAFIEMELEAEAVCAALAEDQGFALEVWKDIADRWHKGMLLDDMMDLVQSGFDLREKQALVGTLEIMAATVKAQIESADYEGPSDLGTSGALFDPEPPSPTVISNGACQCCGVKPVAYTIEQECIDCYTANTSEESP